MNIKSPSGCIHVVSDSCGLGHSTLCNHIDSRASLPDSQYHDWEKTTDKVTCKRCINRLGEVISNAFHKETAQVDFKQIHDMGTLKEYLTDIDHLPKNKELDKIPVVFDTSDRSNLILLSSYYDEEAGVVRVDIGDSEE